MHQEQVYITGLQLLERILQRPEHIVVAVQVIPHFGRNKDILALDRGVFFQEVLNGIADFVFIQIVPCAIEMAVSDAQGVGDGLVGFAFCTFVGKGAEADGGDGDAVA